MAINTENNNNRKWQKKKKKDKKKRMAINITENNGKSKPNTDRNNNKYFKIIRVRKVK